MKRLNYILLILIVFYTSCSQKTIVLTEDELPDDIFYLKDEIYPFTGTCLVYFSNSEQIKEEMCFKNGLLDGRRTSYYRNGKVKRQGEYHKGDLNGKWTGFDNKGNKIYEINYKNDTLVGCFVSWYSTGIIEVKGNYYNNQKVGKWIHYDESGMILSSIDL